MENSRFRLSLIFWLLAPAALVRRLCRRRSGWIDAAADQTADKTARGS